MQFLTGDRSKVIISSGEIAFLGFGNRLRSKQDQSHIPEAGDNLEWQLNRDVLGKPRRSKIYCSLRVLTFYFGGLSKEGEMGRQK